MQETLENLFKISSGVIGVSVKSNGSEFLNSVAAVLIVTNSSKPPREAVITGLVGLGLAGLGLGGLATDSFLTGIVLFLVFSSLEGLELDLFFLTTFLVWLVFLLDASLLEAGLELFSVFLGLELLALLETGISIDPKCSFNSLF